MKKSWAYLKLKSGHQIKIDREDLNKLREMSWRVTEATTGRSRVVTSVRTPEGVRTVGLGKFLMKPRKGYQVYPRRFNEGLDYRKENLIVCTVRERQRLLPKRKSASSSQYRGVSWVKASKKWRAGIEKDGQSINLGEFTKETEAALAYNKAASKLFGQSAYQNPIGRAKKTRND